MRLSRAAGLFLGALAGLASVVGVGVGVGNGCAAFGEEARGGGLEAGASEAAVEPAAPRDVRVEVLWPTVTGLDPASDLRATRMNVVLTDATDPARTVQKSLSPIERGPFDFPGFATSNLVDVTVELLGRDDRRLGYGERRRWDLAANATVPVAARQRLVYFTSADRGEGELRVLGMTPPDMAEPAMDEPALPPLASLRSPSALYISSDGLLLVQAGRERLAEGGTGAGAVSVFETGSHAARRTIALPFVPRGVAPLGDGHRLLAAPGGNNAGTTFALVDLDSGGSTDLPSGLVGGSIDTWSVTASPDGTHAAAVGAYVEASGQKPHFFYYEAGARNVTHVDLSTLLEVARGVRFSPDGKSLIVAGATRAPDWSTGTLLVFEVSPLGISSAPRKTITLTPNVTRSSSLLLHPDGKHAYVGHETRYASGTCCGEFRIVDLETGAEPYVSGFGASGPEHDIVSGIRLPYPPYRAFGGQSDNGNNVHGPVVEITTGGAKPTRVMIQAQGDIGSLDGMATPFGALL